MPDLKIGFTSFDRTRGVLVVFCAEGLKFGPATQKILSAISDHVRRAAAVDRFTGKSGSTLNIIAPTGLNAPRLVVVGIGKERDLKDRDLVRLGGVAIGGVPGAAAQATIVTEFAAGALRVTRSPVWYSVRVCARTGSIGIKPSPRKARSGRPRWRSISPAPIRPPRKRPGPPRLVLPTAWSWRATSSTSQRMFFIRGSSRAALATCENSASSSRFLTWRR